MKKTLSAGSYFVRAKIFGYMLATTAIIYILLEILSGVEF